MTGLQPTYKINTPNRSDFIRDDFQTLIQQKGRSVILEKVLLCACKSQSANQQSNCKNCGGVGWLWINPINTRMILKGMKITPDFKAWSESITGDLEVTASDTEELTYMDRLTLLDSRALYNEVLFFKTKGLVTFAYTAYEMKEIKYVGYFTGVNSIFQRLNNGVDYIFDKNIIKLINPAIVAVQGSISITIRYVHAPVYYMIDMKRESMETFVVVDGTEKIVHLPISGTARRAHYIPTANNLNGDRLLSNNYNGPCGAEVLTFSSQQSVVLPPYTAPPRTITFPFINQNSVSVNHGLGRLVSVTIYDESSVLITANVQATDNNNVLVTFATQQSGTIVIQ